MGAPSPYLLFTSVMLWLVGFDSGGGGAGVYGAQTGSAGDTKPAQPMEPSRDWWVQNLACKGHLSLDLGCLRNCNTVCWTWEEFSKIKKPGPRRPRMMDTKRRQKKTN